MWVNASPVAGPSAGALASWPEAPPLAVIHPRARRPHRQAVALVQLTHALLLARAGAGSSLAPSPQPADTDIVLGTATGSHEVDTEFALGVAERGSGFGSPSTFVYTLSTAAPAEVALALGFRGALDILSAGTVSGLFAVARAVKSIRQGRARACLTGETELGAVTGGEFIALFLLEASEPNEARPCLTGADLGFDPHAAARGGRSSDSPMGSMLALASACADRERRGSIEISGASREGYWATVHCGNCSHRSE
ncbi:MAG: beta-ketoacyl synthase N-terminal-like domain-containing protein [Myxococcaceae bacterium]